MLRGDTSLSPLTMEVVPDLHNCFHRSRSVSERTGFRYTEGYVCFCPAGAEPTESMKDRHAWCTDDDGLIIELAIPIDIARECIYYPDVIT